MLGLSFMLVFTGFNTMGGIQQLIFKSKADFTGDGYWSLAIIYMVFTMANWIAPSVLAILGPRLTMIVGALTYAAFIAQLLILNAILLYVMSAVLGIGAAIIWTAQGNFLSQNTDDTNISMYSGIFWAMSISSGLIGNVFVYTQFQGKDKIDDATRNTVGVVLLSVTCAGIICMFFLRRPATSNSDSTEDPPQSRPSPAQALKESFRLFLTKDMLLLCLTFFYTGINLNIWSAVYGTSIGFTKNLPDRKALATISGMFVSVGEIVGGLVFGILGKLFVRRGRDPIVVLGFVLSMTAYFLAFINLPNMSPIGETSNKAYIESNQYLAIFTSFILGFSDACFNTQVFSILGGTFREESASAFAIFKFVQSLAASIAFWYSSVLPLYWQLLIAVIFDVIGTISFCTVEWRRSKDQSKKEDNTCGISPE